MSCAAPFDARVSPTYSCWCPLRLTAGQPRPQPLHDASGPTCYEFTAPGKNGETWGLTNSCKGALARARLLCLLDGVAHSLPLQCIHTIPHDHTVSLLNSTVCPRRTDQRRAIRQHYHTQQCASTRRVATCTNADNLYHERNLTHISVCIVGTTGLGLGRSAL